MKLVDKLTGHKYNLKGTQTIGRNQGCGIVVPIGEKRGRVYDKSVINRALSVSRTHCEIEAGDDCAIVSDLGSHNGTYVVKEKNDGGIQVGQRPGFVRVVSGDVICLGSPDINEGYVLELVK